HGYAFGPAFTSLIPDVLNHRFAGNVLPRLARQARGCIACRDNAVVHISDPAVRLRRAIATRSPKSPGCRRGLETPAHRLGTTARFYPCSGPAAPCTGDKLEYQAVWDP